MKAKYWVALVSGLIGVVLAGLLFPAKTHPELHAPTAHSHVEVMCLSCALKAYRVEYGAWPTGDQALIVKTLTGNNPQKITFMKVLVKSLNQKGEFVDPWSTPYAISFSNDEPRVSSAGPNRQFGDQDDICSWK